MYLAIYDVRSIQKYIFQGSPKLKENIGASIIVANITKEFLYETIKENCQYYFIDWENDRNFKLPTDPTYEAEVIYSGGGNAIVAYQNIEIAQKVNKALSEKIFLRTGENLLVSVIEEVTGNDFEEDVNQLQRNLNKKKHEQGQSKPMLGLSITELCTRSQLPVSNKDTTESILKYIPYELYCKQKAAEILQMNEQNSNPYFDSSKYEMPLDLDDLGRGEGESYIAVVHIDGNSLGKTIQKHLNGYKNYQDAIAFMRTFSAFISKSYRETFQEMTKQLIHAIENDSVKRLTLKQRNGKNLLPLRNIIMNGDDVTFVCDARIALSLVEIFLTNLQTRSFPNSNEKLSACAGIAIVKPHFPFQQAYRIAELCCAHAKLKAKVLHPEAPKSWLDFHVVQGGISEDLHQTRQKYYMYPTPSLKKGYDAYHLLWRPWFVGEESDQDTERYNIKKFHQIYSHFINNWPRHRLNQFRRALLQGENETELFYNEAKSRNLEVPNCFDGTVLTNESKIFTADNMTPFFDVLEMIDLYIPLEKEESIHAD